MSDRIEEIRARYEEAARTEIRPSEADPVLAILESWQDIPDLLEYLATLEAVEGALLAYIRDAALSGNLTMLERAADLRPVLTALSVRWPDAIKPQESTPIDSASATGA